MPKMRIVAIEEYPVFTIDTEEESCGQGMPVEMTDEQITRYGEVFRQYSEMQDELQKQFEWIVRKQRGTTNIS